MPRHKPETQPNDQPQDAAVKPNPTADDLDAIGAQTVPSPTVAVTLTRTYKSGSGPELKSGITLTLERAVAEQLVAEGSARLAN